MTEQAPDRGALIADGAVRPDHGDQVARVAHERAEARLAAAAVHLLGERGPRERKRDLCGERSQRCTDGLGRFVRPATRRSTRSALWAARSSTSTRSWSAGSSSAVSTSGRSLTTSPASPASAASSSAASRPLAGGCGRGADSRDEVRPRHGAGGRQRDLVDLLAARRGHEVAARGAQHPLPLSERSCWRMSPAIRETTRPKSDEGGRTDHREVVVPAPQVVDDADGRRDQRRAREQPQAESRQQPAGLFSGLIDLGHRGMEGGRAPEEVEADPAAVEPDLVVVRALHEHQAVDEVRGQQADDAGDHQVEGQAARGRRRAPAAPSPPAAARRPAGTRPTPVVRGRQRMVVDVGGDQPHPRGEREPDRHDRRVDRAAAVAPADCVAAGSSPPAISAGYTARYAPSPIDGNGTSRSSSRG